MTIQGTYGLCMTCKLLQVVAILEAGRPIPFTIQAADLDLPELQGEPEDIAKEKCRLAAQQACISRFHPSIATPVNADYRLLTSLLLQCVCSFPRCMLLCRSAIHLQPLQGTQFYAALLLKSVY